MIRKTVAAVVTGSILGVSMLFCPNARGAEGRMRVTLIGNTIIDADGREWIPMPEERKHEVVQKVVSKNELVFCQNGKVLARGVFDATTRTWRTISVNGASPDLLYLL